MSKVNVITLGGGCFWCTEAVFKRVKGVESVESGYSGGKKDNPDYHEVSKGETGHAEVVQVKYDEEVISTKDILEIFFKTHDPTTLNRQGNDVGTQYRSVVFYHNEDQKKLAGEVISEVNAEKYYENYIVTEVLPFKEFYKAEVYHQNYYELNKNQPYCRVVIDPKITKFLEKFKDIVNN